MKLYKLGKGVAQYYRKYVKGNQNASYGLIQRKLTRNILLAEQMPKEYIDKTLYRYGNLLLLVVDDEIVWIKNIYNAAPFKKNMLKYKMLNILLGINKLEKKEIMKGVKSCSA